MATNTNRRVVNFGRQSQNQTPEQEPLVPADWWMNIGLPMEHDDFTDEDFVTLAGIPGNARSMRPSQSHAPKAEARNALLEAIEAEVEAMRAENPQGGTFYINLPVQIRVAAAEAAENNPMVDSVKALTFRRGK